MVMVVQRTDRLQKRIAWGVVCGVHGAQAALMDCRFRNEVITLAAIIANPFEYGNASISCSCIASSALRRAFLFFDDRNRPVPLRLPIITTPPPQPLKHNLIQCHHGTWLRPYDDYGQAAPCLMYVIRLIYCQIALMRLFYGKWRRPGRNEERAGKRTGMQARRSPPTSFCTSLRTEICTLFCFDAVFPSFCFSFFFFLELL